MAPRKRPGSTGAHDAASQGHKDVLLALLDAGCDINVGENHGMTPLMRGCRL